MQFEVGKKYKIVKGDGGQEFGISYGGTDVKVGDIVVCSGVDNGDARGYGLSFRGIKSDDWFFASPKHLESGYVVLLDEDEE